MCPSQSDFGSIPKGQQLGELIRLLRRVYHRRPGAPTSPLPAIHFEGTTPEGDLMVRVEQGPVAYRLAIEGEWVLRRLAGPLLDPPRDLDPARLPYQPRTSQLLPIRSGKARAGKPQSRVLAGPRAQSVDAVEAIAGQRLAVAAFTSRGPTRQGQGIVYKDYNEDGVVIRLRKALAHGTEIAAIGAFDQAGGEGSVAGSPGAASELVATLFDQAVAKIEAGGDPAAALKESVQRAGDAIRALSVGAMSTAAGAVILSTPDEPTARAYLVTLGDSRILQVDARGALKRKTVLHNLGARISAGLEPEAPPEVALNYANALTRGIGSPEEVPDQEIWELEAGDFLVAATDGLGDARENEDMPQGVWHADRCAEDQATLVHASGSAGAAVAALVAYALDQMADLRGKPDNLGIAVAEVLPQGKRSKRRR